MSYRLSFAIFVALGLSTISDVHAESPQQPSADAVFFGGDILTIDGDRPEYVEALVVSGEDISFVGGRMLL